MKVPKHLMNKILNLPYEQWRDIEKYEGLYQVSNLGRVKSLNYNHTDKARVLKPGTTNGYLFVMLCKNNKPYPYLVHQLVAKAFIPNPNNLPEVNHKFDEPELRDNNYVSNLEWCTHGYNINYGTRNKKAGKSNSKPVIMLSKNNEPLAVFDSTKEANEYLGKNKYNSNISHCMRGLQQTAWNYKWKEINIIEHLN